MINKKDVNVSQINAKLLYTEKEISEDFINKNINIVKSISSKLIYSGKVPPCIEFEDLVSWGVEGLIKAKASFNTNLKTKFQTYAYYRIKGEIMDSIRNEWSYRMPQEFNEKKEVVQEKVVDFIEKTTEESTGSSEKVAANTLKAASFVHYLSNEINNVVASQKGMGNPEEEKVDQNYDELWTEINGLEDIEIELIKLFYINGMKQKDIAKHLDLSQSKVCRIHLKVLKKLKFRLKEIKKDE